MHLGSPWSRRRFLSRSVEALTALSLGPVACGGNPTGPSDSGRLPPGTPVRVVVVGAGLSGLVAAYELHRAGHEVKVLEARARPGGRVSTLRTPFDDGRFAEAGAARIPPHHDLTLGYIDHFGLATSPFYPDEGRYLVVSDGARVERSPEAFLGARASWLTLRDGTARLPAAFADSLGSRIRYEAPVTEIVRSGGEARAVVGADPDGGRSGTGGSDEVAADHRVCTVPLPVLDRIRFDPPLSTAKRGAILSLGYWDVTRVFVRHEERPWEEEGLNGWAATDWPEELWHPTWDQPGPGGILMSYMFNQRARQIAALGHDEIVDVMTAHFEDVFPGSALHAGGGTFVVWRDDPWAGGAFADLAAPAFSTRSELALPEGPVHFAGEHASDHRGWMQGALRSGLRAAHGRSTPGGGGRPLNPDARSGSASPRPVEVLSRVAPRVIARVVPEGSWKSTRGSSRADIAPGPRRFLTLPVGYSTPVPRKVDHKILCP